MKQPANVATNGIPPTPRRGTKGDDGTMRKSKATVAAEQQEAQQAQIRAALRWSDDADIAPDVPPPPAWREMTTGWTFNAYSQRVEVACSSAASHSVGRTDKTTTQQPLALYSTRERALRALRVALEREFAAELAKIDAQIAAERER
jgi:hypothetical protein